MPALPPQPNCLKYQLFFSLGTNVTVSTRMYFTYSGTPPTGAILNGFAQTAADTAGNQLAQCMHPQNAFERCDIIDLTSATGAVGTHAARVAGNRTGAPLAAATCMLENFDIGRRYRGGKPRVYWPFGVSADLVTPSQWTSAFLTLCYQSTESVIAAIASSTSGGTAVQMHVSISYYQGFTARTDPVTGRTEDVPKVRPTAIPPDQVLGRTMNPRISTQRRRIQL